MKNIEKYQKLIAKGEVDALLLTSKHNRQYAAEYCIAEASPSSARRRAIISPTSAISSRRRKTCRALP